MKERPILFASEMVRAILDGRKTQTRRQMKRQPLPGSKLWLMWKQEGEDRAIFWCEGQRSDYGTPSPFQTGDRLWVRETWGLHSHGDMTDWAIRGDDITLDRWEIQYRCDWGPCQDGCFWRPSIHMPRWASRITLEITAVRVERVQEISRGDAMEEGCPFANMAEGPSPRDWFRDLWQSIYGTWDANLFVWVYDFRRVK